jgi:hypothetical protein
LKQGLALLINKDEGRQRVESRLIGQEVMLIGMRHLMTTVKASALDR